MKKKWPVKVDTNELTKCSWINNGRKEQKKRITDGVECPFLHCRLHALLFYGRNTVFNQIFPNGCVFFFALFFMYNSFFWPNIIANFHQYSKNATYAISILRILHTICNILRIFLVYLQNSSLLRAIEYDHHKHWWLFSESCWTASKGHKTSKCENKTFIPTMGRSTTAIQSKY